MGKKKTAGDRLVEELNAALGEDLEWDEREAAIVDLVRRQADDIERLELMLSEQGSVVDGSRGQPRLSPIYSEVRQSRLALQRLLSALRLPDEGPSSSRSVRHQRAARARWDRRVSQ